MEIVVVGELNVDLVRWLPPLADRGAQWPGPPAAEPGRRTAAANRPHPRYFGSTGMAAG
jgi:hypothetical protein